MRIYVDRCGGGVMTHKEFLETQVYSIKSEIKEIETKYRINVAVHAESMKIKKQLLDDIELQLTERDVQAMVKRYELDLDKNSFDCNCEMQEFSDGEFVYFDDYKKLEKENEELLKIICDAVEKCGELIYEK